MYNQYLRIIDDNGIFFVKYSQYLFSRMLYNVNRNTERYPMISLFAGNLSVCSR